MFVNKPDGSKVFIPQKKQEPEAPKVDLSKKIALVIDTPDGIAIEHAVRLAKDFGRVKYLNYVVQSFPLFEQVATGLGMEVEKVDHVKPHIDSADLVCCFDVGFSEDIEGWRKDGKAVFGGGAIEYLEEDRAKARMLQKSLKLPTQNTEPITGVTNLEKYLKEKKNVWVKIDKFRGNIKSFYFKDYESSALKFDEIRSAFGPWKENIDFIIEEAIDNAVETGCDPFFNGTDIIRPAMWGIEVSHAYIARWDEILPQIFETYLSAILDEFRAKNFRGSFSTEQRAISNLISYMIDWTIRMAYPLSLIFTEAILNYSELIWACANGLPIKIKPAAKYAACAPVYSQHAEKNWLRLIIEEKKRNRIKLQGVLYGEGFYHCVKGSQNGATLIGLGNSVDECIAEIQETSKFIDAEGLEKEGVDVLDKIIKEVEKLKEIGINF